MNLYLYYQCVLICELTIKTAMAPPMMKPAMTSDQWLRYSATRTMPTRTANDTRVRQRVGLVSLVPLVFHIRVTYICRKHKNTQCIALTHIFHDNSLSSIQNNVTLCNMQNCRVQNTLVLSFETKLCPLYHFFVLDVF